MSIEKLKLGQSVDELLKTTNANFNEIAGTLDEWSETVESGGTKAIAFSTTDKMISCLNANQTEDEVELKLNIGDEIYIIDENEPDFWIVGKNTMSSVGSCPDDWVRGEIYTFGYYQIQRSKQKEINLQDYVTHDELEEELEEKLENVGCVKDVFVDDESVVGIDKIARIYLGEHAGGKVKDVLVNDESVLDDEGLAKINIEDFQSYYTFVSSSSTLWRSLSINDNEYWALATNADGTNIEMINSKGETIIYQTIKEEDTLYLCVSEKIDCYLRRIDGSAVSLDLRERTNVIETVLSNFFEQTITETQTFTVSGAVGEVEGSMHIVRPSFTNSYEKPYYYKLSNASLTNNNISTSTQVAIVADGSFNPIFNGFAISIRDTQLNDGVKVSVALTFEFILFK